jgi:hypothetical protein
MKSQPALKQKPHLHLAEQPKPIRLQIGDRVEIAGISHHQGVIVDFKDSPYSGLTYSVKVGGKRLDGVNPLALKPC